jgi:hypothetical protein
MSQWVLQLYGAISYATAMFAAVEELTGLSDEEAIAKAHALFSSANTFFEGFELWDRGRRSRWHRRGRVIHFEQRPRMERGAAARHGARAPRKRKFSIARNAWRRCRSKTASSISSPPIATRCASSRACSSRWRKSATLTGSRCCLDREKGARWPKPGNSSDCLTGAVEERTRANLFAMHLGEEGQQEGSELKCPTSCRIHAWSLSSS